MRRMGKYRLLRVTIAAVIGPAVSLASVTTTLPSSQDFGQTTVSPAAPVLFSLAASFTGLTANPKFSLAYGTDFSIGTATCSTSSGTISCTLPVTFKPRNAGLRLDAVLSTDSKGNPLGATFLHGIGAAAQIALYPGTMTTFAGTGSMGYSGDNGLATKAMLSNPDGLAIDQLGNVYISDSLNQVVRKVSVSTGNITTAAGLGGAAGFSGDGGPATQALLQTPGGLAIDGMGNLYIADQGNNRIRRVTPSGQISTVAGGGTASSQADRLGDGGPATSAILSGPSDVALDAAGNLYIADSFNGLIREVNAVTGIISVVAGGGGGGGTDGLGDGGPATGAILNNPRGIAFDASGNLYIADSGHSMIRKVNSASGTITAFAGNGQYGYSGDLGPATSAELSQPVAVRADAAGNVYIADDAIHFVREVQASNGIIFTLTSTPTGTAVVSAPQALALDPQGNIYVASPPANMIVEISPLPQPVSFGTVNVGQQSATYPLTALDIGNLPLTFSSITVPSGFVQQPSGSVDCSKSTAVAPGSSCVIALAFVPSKTGAASGTLILSENSLFESGEDLSLTGTGGSGTVPRVSVSPASAAFGTVTLGTTAAPLQVTVSNTGGATLSITGMSLSGVNAADFNIYANTCGSSLAAGASCNISLTFSPGATGSRSAFLVLTDSVASSPQSIPLTGTGAVSGTATLSTSTINFPSQNVKSTSSAQNLLVTNTGNGNLSVSAISIAGANPSDFSASNGCSAAIAPGAGCTISVTFLPSAPGSRVAALTLTGSASNLPQTVGLAGVGIGVPAASLSLSSLNFGSISVRAVSASQTVSLSNSGSAVLAITGIQLTGTNTNDFGMSTTCQASLAINSSCSISVVFAPSAGGVRTAAVTITDSSAGSPQTVSLNGTGLLNPAASATPASISFGAQAVGSPAVAQTVQLSNTGNTSLSISSVSIVGGNAGDFKLVNNCQPTLGIGANCGVSVTFTPSADGLRSAVLTFTDSAANSTQTVTLSGSGTGTPKIALNTTAFNFGVLPLGGSSTQVLALSNSGNAALEISGMTIGGANAGDFKLVTSSCGNMLAPNANCAITVQFSAGSVGTRTASLYVSDPTG
ncbi:MAG: choice-of-anchor D domain-containing protein, partial [Acidobacteriaceae bacterium]|nr:choice-of-anchor D domain-containing protein [Acidobacteriaceae bacterium]